MSGLMEKLKDTAKQAVDTRTRGMSGFETGVGDSIATQDLADGLYENPRESVAVCYAIVMQRMLPCSMQKLTTA